MIVPTLALTASLLAATPVPADAPTAAGAGFRVHAARESRDAKVQALTRYTVADAPTTPFGSFAASGLTSLTGLFVGVFALTSLPDEGLPGSTFSFHARMSTALLLLSAGPSVGDLMNHDPRGFLMGALGRTAIAALGYGALAWAVSSGGSSGATLVASMVLGLGGLGWLGWSIADLVRSFFAPRRWVDRQNQALTAGAVPSRAPIPEVRQTGALRL
ncbi:MAG: hypothetical protein WBV82_06395 [Myxococcaceae bacterium]